MGIYKTVIDQVLKEVQERRQIHGSRILELLQNHLYGVRYVDSYDAEQIINELVAEGKLVVAQKAPNHNQAAFAGLQYTTKAYKNVEWVAGVKTHYWYLAPERDGRV